LPQKIANALKSEHGQPLILYISATHVAISGSLMVKKEIVNNGKATKQQFLVYFILEVKDQRRQLEEGVNESLKNFLRELGLYLKTDPTYLSFNSTKST
jgi:hypothetical protein